MPSKTKPCRTCSKEIATSAKLCPHCGAKLKMGMFKKLLIGFGILVLLGIIANADKQDGTSISTSSNNPASPTRTVVKNKESAEVIQAKIGVVVNVEHFVYRVDNISFKKAVGDFFQETADGIYLIVSLSIKNVSNETRTLDGSMFKLINSQGHEFEHSTNGSTALEMSGQKTLFLKQCQPNIQTSGKLIFEVPDANDRYTLKVSGGFWTGKMADIALVK